MDTKKINKSINKAAKGLWKSLPLILGTILIISLISVLIPRSFYTSIFRENLFLNSIMGGIIGSISAGNPITSYIFGGEMLKQGVSLLVVTAFLITWVTVGLIQLPAESMMLSKKFAIIRNIISFISAIIISIITVFILGVI